MKKHNRLAILLVAAAMACGGGAQSLAPINASGWIERGKSLYSIGNYTGAIDQLRYIEKLPTTAEQRMTADFFLAMSAYQAGDDAALGLLTTFVQQYPMSDYAPAAQKTIGDWYFYHGKFGEAVVCYDKLPANSLNFSDNADLVYRTGYSELRLGNFERALSCFQNVESDKKYRDAVKFYNGYVAYAKGDFAKAKTDFESVVVPAELQRSSLYYLAQIDFARGAYENVVALNRRNSLTDGPEEFSPEMCRIVGESYYHLKDYDNSQKYLKRYIDITPEGNSVNRSAYYLLGVNAYDKGAYDEVLTYMENVVGESDAMAQSAYLYVGQAYVDAGNLKAATVAFEKAMKMNYDKQVTETAFFNYAVAVGKGSKVPFSPSVNYFQQFVNEFPKSRYTQRVEDYLVNAYVSGNDYQKALASIEKIDNPSKKVLQAKQYVLLNLGMNSVSAENYTLAADYLTKARQLGNLDNGIIFDVDLWLGDCRYRQGNYAAARSAWQNYVSSAKPTDKNYYIGLYNLGYSEFALKNYSAAASDFKKAIAAKTTLDNSYKADALVRLADCSYYAKKYKEASELYSKAAATNPETGDYAMFMDAMMKGLQKQYAEKIARLDAMMLKYPNSPMCAAAVYEKGLANLDHGNSDAAAAEFERLVAAYPQSAEARKGLLQLAITLRTQGKETQAVANYKKVISKYPSSEEAALAAEDLKVIYAERGAIDELQSFLSSIGNAPRLDVAEVDRLTFEAAEKAYLGKNNDISQIKKYVQRYPNGAYIAQARFYIAQGEYANGNFGQALEQVNQLLENAPSASFAEDALAMKGNILYGQGKYKESLSAFTDLQNRATVNRNTVEANKGVMRSATKLNQYPAVITAAGILLGSQGVSDNERAEARYLRAEAYAASSRENEAVKDWTELAMNLRNEYGAKASYSLAQYWFDKGDTKKSEKLVNEMIDAGTPYQYWLARNFILLSDIYVSQNKTFEAREYLESLKENYPGSEPDIFEMINARLKTIKSAK